MIAASVALMASFSAVAGLGGLNVQSHLGEPFSGTVTVTGDEAKILLSGGKASISDNRLSTSVRKSGDNAIVSIRSSGAVRDPVLVFQMGVGAQARQYTAIIDPPGYASGSTANRAPVRQADEPAARASERGSRVAAAPRPAQSRPAPAKAPERQNTRVAAGEYTVRSGETLMGIASRVRPAGLSTRQTMLALVQANPEIFESGSPDRIWPGNVLNIPAAEELHRLAKPGEPVPVTPAEPVPTPAASEPVTEPASAPVAAPVEASAPVVTASEAVAQPASEPVVVPAPQTDPEPDPRESGSWWRWLLLGGLGLIALWMLSKMLGKKHKTVVFKEEEDEASPFDTQSGVAADAPVEKASASEEGIRTHQPVARPSNNAPLTRAEAAATLAAGKVATEGKGKSESSGL
ncbi:MAG TPA: FimV/HubP family polar landmark protein, partial [Neisseria sp.]|nr:FimV/HubP family polar landmark protein [Neisseria sp.]